MNKLIDEYKHAKQDDIPVTSFLHEYKLELIEEDYENGYVFRYFAQFASNPKAPIIEISKRNFSRRNDSYVKVKVKWRIIGPKNEIEKSNTLSIALSLETIPTLNYYLYNKLEFWLGQQDEMAKILKKVESLK